MPEEKSGRNITLNCSSTFRSTPPSAEPEKCRHCGEEIMQSAFNEHRWIHRSSESKDHLAAPSTPAAPKRDAVSTWGFSENLPVLPKATLAAPAETLGICDEHDPAVPHKRHSSCDAWRPVADPPPQPSAMNPANEKANIGLASTFWRGYCQREKLMEGPATLDWWGFQWAGYVLCRFQALAAHPSAHAEPIDERAAFEALKIAVEQMWMMKAGLMDIRDATELTPIKEQWIAGKIADLLAEARASLERRK